MTFRFAELGQEDPQRTSYEALMEQSTWKWCPPCPYYSFWVKSDAVPIAAPWRVLQRSQSQRKTWCHWWEENNQNELRRTPVLCRSREENRRQVIRFSTRSSSKEEVATFRKNHGLLWLLWRLWLRLWGLWLQPLCACLLLQTCVLLCASLFLLQLWLLWGLQGRLWFLWLLPVQLLQALLLPVQLLCPRVLPV
nr:uncharacterized protein LOC105469801 [Macaca nemestrina]